MNMLVFFKHEFDLLKGMLDEGKISSVLADHIGIYSISYNNLPSHSSQPLRVCFGVAAWPQFWATSDEGDLLRDVSLSSGHLSSP